MNRDFLAVLSAVACGAAGGACGSFWIAALWGAAGVISGLVILDTHQ